MNLICKKNIHIYNYLAGLVKGLVKALIID